MAAHASIYNHFNHDRHLNRRDIFKQNRSAALVEWRQLAGIVRANSFTLPKRQNRISWSLIFLHFSGSI
jgi:hypothetical protein